MKKIRFAIIMPIFILLVGPDVSAADHGGDSGKTAGHSITARQTSDRTTAAVDEGSCDGRSWTSLFDGQTLEGWHIKSTKADRDKTFWTVADGKIVCNSMDDGKSDYVWLMTPFTNAARSAPKAISRSSFTRIVACISHLRTSRFGTAKTDAGMKPIHLVAYTYSTCLVANCQYDATTKRVDYV